MAQSLKDRVHGSLLGLAVGDALGTTVEFMPPGSFEEVTDMQGGGKFSLQPGQWTDDTSMALCLAESLIECRGFNLLDQLRRYWRWYQEGHLSSNGECFDIGMTVRKALHNFERSNETEPYPGPTSDRAAGNGSLMRLAPVPLVYHRHPLVALELSKESSRTTHGAKAALDACRYFSGLIVGCLQGASKEELLSPHYSPCGADYWSHHPMVTFRGEIYWFDMRQLQVPEVDAIAAGSFKSLEPPDIKASGYVVHSLEAILWAFHKSSTFKEGCLKVVNLGDDADTVGAIYGQLGGAYYGAESIPLEWRQKCALLPLIELFAGELEQLSGSISNPDVPIPETLDWSKVNTTFPHNKLSDVYQNLKIKGYDLLEQGNREVVRKLNPCPKQYKTLDAFDADVKELVERYHALPPEAQSSELLLDFEMRWRYSREKLTQRLSRRRI